MLPDDEVNNKSYLPQTLKRFKKTESPRCLFFCWATLSQYEPSRRPGPYDRVCGAMMALQRHPRVQL